MYPTRVVLACLARTSCINAAMTARGMQQIGLAYVLEPALRELYPEPQTFARAMSRVVSPRRCHSALTGFTNAKAMSSARTRLFSGLMMSNSPFRLMSSSKRFPKFSLFPNLSMPKIAEDLKLMDERIFKDELMGLKDN